MNIKDLITDFGTGRLSHTKLWSNIANLTATCIVIIQAINGSLLVDIFIAYLVFVGASSLGSKFLSMKFGKNGDISVENTEGK
jgi:hypothetical protein